MSSYDLKLNNNKMPAEDKTKKSNISNCEIFYWDTGHGVRSEKPNEFIQLMKNFINEI